VENLASEITKRIRKKPAKPASWDAAAEAARFLAEARSSESPEFCREGLGAIESAIALGCRDPGAFKSRIKLYCLNAYPLFSNTSICRGAGAVTPTHPGSGDETAVGAGPRLQSIGIPGPGLRRIRVALAGYAGSRARFQPSIPAGAGLLDKNMRASPGSTCRAFLTRGITANFRNRCPASRRGTKKIISISSIIPAGHG